jgi:3-dehydroquinate dehydratase-2
VLDDPAIRAAAAGVAREIAALPSVEVHLSAVEEREQWRRTSVVRELCLATVTGKGPEGYRDALARLEEELSA